MTDAEQMPNSVPAHIVAVCDVFANYMQRMQPVIQ